MAANANATVLCIHRDPPQLTLLHENGYGVVTATSGCEGLRLLMTQTVDAVVLEYYLGLLDGAIVADEIKQVRPHIPVVMLADPLGLPHAALKSVDTLVDKSDGPHFLWAALHFLLSTKAQQGRSMIEARTLQGRRRETRSRTRAGRSNQVAAAPSNEASPFSAERWKSILDGTVQF
jgi:DNA-binding response OmpR family regulator